MRTCLCVRKLGGESWILFMGRFFASKFSKCSKSEMKEREKRAKCWTCSRKKIKALFQNWLALNFTFLLKLNCWASNISCYESFKDQFIWQRCIVTSVKYHSASFFAQSVRIELALPRAARLSILKENQKCCTSVRDLNKDALLIR